MTLDNIVETYMPIAKPLSMAMERQKKHISLIIYKRKIIAVGQNIFKTHPDTLRLGYRTADMHSELDAYRKVPRQFKNKKLTLINVRMNADGELRMSRPCIVCSGWCVEVFDKIYYTDNEGFKRL